MFTSKTRTPLSPEYQAIFDEWYGDNREGNGISKLSKIFERWMHRQIAKTRFEANKILEIGCGTLNHYQYEADANPVYDVIEPYVSLFENVPERSRIRNIYSDISEVPDCGEFDRIIAVASFEHILNLEEVIDKCSAATGKSATLCVGIPNQGHFPWKLAYSISTGVEFKRRFGLDYNVLMNYEHCNSADEIDVLIRKYYSNVKRLVFGINGILCLYRVYIANNGGVKK